MLTRAPAGIATGIDPLRYTGFAPQSAGLDVKAAGEAYKWEDGNVDLAAILSGDIAKAAGALVSSAAPILQGVALATQRRLEAQIAAGNGTGPIPPLPAAVAATLPAGGTAGGDFASEVVKGIRRSPAAAEPASQLGLTHLLSGFCRGCRGCG